MVSTSFTNRPILGSWRIWSAVLGLSAAVTLSFATPYGSSAVSAVLDAQDGLEEFLARSPGERGNVLAMKGKGKGGKYALVEKGGPSGVPEEALGRIFDMPGVDTPEDVAAFDQAPIYVDNPSLALGPTFFLPGGFGPGGVPGGGGGVGGGSPGGSTPPGGGGGGGGGNPPPVGAIPEPSTWALMILGFGGIGGAMRRRAQTSMGRSHA